MPASTWMSVASSSSTTSALPAFRAYTPSVTWFAAPRSYTGEDVVEIACHGAPVVLRFCVEQACRKGARLAEPGEFTWESTRPQLAELYREADMASIAAFVSGGTD